MSRVGISNRSFQADTDLDGLTQLAEFAFGLDPNKADADLLPVSVGGPVAGISGDVSVRFTPRAARARYVTVRVQYSSDGAIWNGLESSLMFAGANGEITAVIPKTPAPVRLRLRVVTIPPYGSGARNTSYIVLR